MAGDSEGKPGEDVSTSPEYAAAKIALKPFLDANPLTSLEEDERPAGGKVLALKRPWGDRSIVLQIPADVIGFAQQLNELVLPQRYSALWHRDTKSFEVLWTAFRPTGGATDVVDRSFRFKFRGHDYECGFRRASERALTLARAFRASGLSDTSYRNLWSFEIFITREPPEVLDQIGDPLSFWIEGLEWDEDYVLALIMHLNFYLSYFDASSPVVILHSPTTNATTNKPTRYPAGKFPQNIASKETEATLLFLWEAARTGDAAQRFLYYYRIIEYSAGAYLDSSARTSLRIALALPNALDDLAAVTESVVAAVQRMKMDEYARYETMLKEIVDPKLLWVELSKNLDAFKNETQFDGGFKVAPLINGARGEADCSPQDVGNFAQRIRDIRNALSHGRDQKTGTTITPTTHNFERLQPWIGPIRVAASQVLLYKGAF